MDSKPLCKYGDKCYRKNPAHLDDFKHPEAKAQDQQSPESPPATVEVSPAPPKSPKTSATPEVAPAAAQKVDSEIPEEAKNSKTVNQSPAESTSNESEDSVRRRNHSFGDSEMPSVKRPAMESGPPKPKCFDENTDISMLKEYKELLKNRREFIRQKFMVSMPDDFYMFWKFCESQNAMEPFDALRVFGLVLTGPYDVLAGKFDDVPPQEPAIYLQHCRYFYDPPEFQTVLVKKVENKRTGVHIGYWRDNPSDANSQCFLAKTDESVGCEVTIMADNIFVAVINFLDNDLPPSPYVREAATTMRKKLKSFAGNNKIQLYSFPEKQRRRNKEVVCRTFHKAGLIVPLNANTQVGYRPLFQNDASLKKILSRLEDPVDGGSEAVLEMVMEKLQPLITAANIAVDESDFGNSIELGIDLFCSGSKRLHAIAMQLLATGYSMVKRPQLIAILKAHMSDRQRGTPKSVVTPSSSPFMPY